MADNAARQDALRQKLVNGQTDFTKYQTEMQSVLTNRQTLLTQLNENNSVLAELKSLKDDEDVFKMVGPVMIKQSKEDAVANVEKRVQFITEEIERANEVMKMNEKKLNDLGAEMNQAQTELKALMEAEAMAAAQNEQ